MRFAVLGAVLWLALPAAIASPEEPAPGALGQPRVAWALAAGIATALIPLTVGGAIYAQGDSLGTKRAAFYVIEGGLALAPLVSHAVAHEWTRGLAFAALPLAAFGGTVVLLELRSDLFERTDPPARIALWSLVTASLLVAMTGVVDSAGAGERARSRMRLAPATGAHHVGLTLEGNW